MLEERLELSRINYDLARRYADASFRNSLLKLSETEALELYNQVLSRIAAHSVNTPDYRALLQRGGNDLSVALSDATFTDAHLRGRSAAQIRQFRNDALKLGQQKRPRPQRCQIGPATNRSHGPATTRHLANGSDLGVCGRCRRRT